ncbi:MAG: glycosyltransferase family 39 protein [Betaproteobacteria bacterium]|nr:glycosyltransferase family 39 protein [Betaproteobacteria bacterium]
MALFALAWFSALDYRKLIKPDEGRYAEIAREMAQSGDWVTPRLNGIKYFEKPPLQYWTTAAAFRAFGTNEWTARLWSGLTGFAGVLLAAATASRLFGPPAGLFAATVLAGSLWWVLMGHLNTLDMGFAFFLQAALAGFLLGQSSQQGSVRERNAMLTAWAAAALAVLSKGLAGVVLPGMVLLAYCLMQREWLILRRLHLLGGLAIFLGLTAPWFIAVQLANPEFARFFFVHEHLDRFTTPTHGRMQPAWYFVPILALALMPWTGIALHACARAWRTPSERGFNARRFLLLWVVLIFIFFSASGSKLPSYILPLLPALALLSGDWLTRATPRALTWHSVSIAALALVAIVLIPAVARNAGGEAPEEMLARYAHWLIVSVSVMLAGSLLASWQFHRQQKFRAIVATGFAALLAWEIGLQGHETLGRSNSAYYIAEQIKPMLHPGVPFYSVGAYEQTLPFYLDRTVTLVEYRDEFSFGLDQEPGLAIPDIQAFKLRWIEHRQAFAMTSPDGFKLLDGQGFAMRIVARDARRIIVSKP